MGKYHEREIGNKTFHYARTCETKEEAKILARDFRNKGYLIRIIPIKTYFDKWWQIFTYPKEQTK